MNASLPLDNPEQPNPSPRPHPYSEAMRKAAARSILSDVMEWLGDDATDEVRVLEQLEDALRYADGYERAKRLDELMWSPDAALVEILESADSYREHQAALREWVTANGIKPKFAVGEVVQIGVEIGTVCAIDTATALYTIKTQKFLAENPGQAKHQSSGLLIPFEHVSPLTN